MAFGLAARSTSWGTSMITSRGQASAGLGHENVVRAQVTVGNPETSHCAEHFQQLANEAVQLLGGRPELVQAWSRHVPVGVTVGDELHQDLASVELHRVRHRDTGLEEPLQAGPLRLRP